MFRSYVLLPFSSREGTARSGSPDLAKRARRNIRPENLHGRRGLGAKSIQTSLLRTLEVYNIDLAPYQPREIEVPIPGSVCAGELSLGPGAGSALADRLCRGNRGYRDGDHGLLDLRILDRRDQLGDEP